ncbi:transglutaminase family protein [Serratia ureilytica]
MTPGIQALADNITAGISDRREQAEALYRWVAQNIRYVAVYLGNGGLEPNSAQSILDNHYGDCKDHVVILEALLAAKGIASSPVLIGMDEGPILPKVPLLSRFNHAITYVPEFKLYRIPPIRGRASGNCRKAIWGAGAADARRQTGAHAGQRRAAGQERAERRFRVRQSGQSARANRASAERSGRD